LFAQPAQLGLRALCGDDGRGHPERCPRPSSPLPQAVGRHPEMGGGLIERLAGARHVGEHLAFELLGVGGFGLWHGVGFLFGFAALPVHQTGVTSGTPEVWSTCWANFRDSVSLACCCGESPPVVPSKPRSGISPKFFGSSSDVPIGRGGSADCWTGCSALAMPTPTATLARLPWARGVRVRA